LSSRRWCFSALPWFLLLPQRGRVVAVTLWFGCCGIRCRHLFFFFLSSPHCRRRCRCGVGIFFFCRSSSCCRSMEVVTAALWVWSLWHSSPQLVFFPFSFLFSLCSWRHCRRGIGVFLLCRGSFCCRSAAGLSQ